VLLDCFQADQDFFEPADDVGAGLRRRFLDVEVNLEAECCAIASFAKLNGLADGAATGQSARGPAL
jgi:hypothetical protein